MTTLQFRIDYHGHFVFEDATTRMAAKSLVKASHLNGEVDLQSPFWVQWHQEYGMAFTQPSLMIWTTVFIPRLMWSIIRDI